MIEKAKFTHSSLGKAFFILENKQKQLKIKEKIKLML